MIQLHLTVNDLIKNDLKVINCVDLISFNDGGQSGGNRIAMVVIRVRFWVSQKSLLYLKHPASLALNQKKARTIYMPITTKFREAAPTLIYYMPVTDILVVILTCMMAKG